MERKKILKNIFKNDQEKKVFINTDGRWMSDGVEYTEEEIKKYKAITIKFVDVVSPGAKNVISFSD